MVWLTGCGFRRLVLSLRVDNRKQSQKENDPPTTYAHKKRESTIGRLPKDVIHAALKHELDRELHIPRSALRNDGITGKDIGSLSELSESVAQREVRQVIKVAAIQNVEDLPAELHLEMFSKFCILDDRHVKLRQARTDQLVAPGGADASGPVSAIAWPVEGSQRNTLVGSSTGVCLGSWVR